MHQFRNFCTHFWDIFLHFPVCPHCTVFILHRSSFEAWLTFQNASCNMYLPLLGGVVTFKTLPTSFRSYPLSCTDCFVYFPFLHFISCWTSLHQLSSLHISVFSLVLFTAPLSHSLAFPSTAICQTYWPSSHGRVSDGQFLGDAFRSNGHRAFRFILTS
jgi:hypothetical protein